MAPRRRWSGRERIGCAADRLGESAGEHAPTRTDVLVVGAGPAGSAAAAWAAQAGLDVLLADAAVFPRDKTCGDGLTPRAIGELQRLGLEDWLRAHTVNQGLRAHGFGQTLLLPWPGGTLPAGAPPWPAPSSTTTCGPPRSRRAPRRVDGARAVDVRMDGGRVAAVESFAAPPDGERFEVACDRLVVADGVRSPLGKLLGREWHRDTVYGVAGRCYVDSTMSDDPWISSHLELRDEQGEILSRLRLDLPARQRRGEHRRRHAGHGQAAGRRRDQAADGALRRRSGARTSGSAASCGCPRRRCCRWAARSRTSPAPTGR